MCYARVQAVELRVHGMKPMLCYKYIYNHDIAILFLCASVSSSVK